MRETPDTPDDPRPPDEGGRRAPDDEIIRIEDLAPRKDIRGGRKILLGEILTPLSIPSVKPEP